MFDFKKFRKDRNITQDKLIELLGYSQSFISQLENGKKVLPEKALRILGEKYGDLSPYISNNNQVDKVTINIGELKNENEVLKKEIEHLKEKIKSLEDDKSFLQDMLKSQKAISQQPKEVPVLGKR